jgi:hypothetical protein
VLARRAFTGFEPIPLGDLPMISCGDH